VQESIFQTHETSQLLVTLTQRPIDVAGKCCADLEVNEIEAVRWATSNYSRCITAPSQNEQCSPSMQEGILKRASRGSTSGQGCKDSVSYDSRPFPAQPSSP
jgi:hypothetical protein